MLSGGDYKHRMVLDAWANFRRCFEHNKIIVPYQLSVQESSPKISSVAAHFRTYSEEEEVVVVVSGCYSSVWC